MRSSKFEPTFTGQAVMNASGGMRPQRFEPRMTTQWRAVLYHAYDYQETIDGRPARFAPQETPSRGNYRPYW